VTFDRVSWPRSTERLMIRPVTVADLPAVFDYRSREDVAEWMPGRPTDYDDWLVLMDRAILERTLVLERDGAVVGDLYLHVQDGWAQHEVRDAATASVAELGWCLDSRHQGQGYVTEAAAELMRICFEDLGLRRVTAEAFADNAPSLRVMEKLGMRAEARHRQDSLHRDLGWVDGVTYAILRDEWRSAR
jgi:RimJ/RimL family protein N-acetyltransferase